MKSIILVNVQSSNEKYLALMVIMEKFLSE